MACILIVEDSPDNMKLFRTLLAMNGHEVIGLPGGDDLLDQVRSTNPDLILMDLQLPGRDGYQLLQELRDAEFPQRVVALTAHAMAGEREKAIAAGFDSYITKPIDVRLFPEQVRRILAGETIAG